MSRDAGWHRSVTGMARRTLEAAFEDNVAFLASALAFSLLLTIAPFTIFVLGVVGHLVQRRVSLQSLSLHDLIAQFLPPGADFAQLELLLGDVVANRGRLTFLGAVLFLWFSTRLFGGLRAALNEVFDTDERRPWPVAKLLDLGMVLVTGALLAANAWASVLGARAEPALGGFGGWAFRFAIGLTTLGFSTVLFFVVYKATPSRPIAWPTAIVASLFTAVAFEAAKRLFALYITRFATFDRLASDANLVAFFLFLLWVYYTCYVFLLGGEVAETYDLVRLRRAQRVRFG